MKKLLKNSYLFIKNRGSISISLMTAIFSALFLVTAIFGLQNSSICAVENQANSFKKSSGSDIRMRLYLSEESEGKRKSVINPLNSFNDYRITEFGRCGSYVLDSQFNISFSKGESISNQILYGDFYSKYYTTNRINLTSSVFDKETFYDKHSIYISRAIVEQIPDLTLDQAVGQKVKLSLDDEEEYVVRGIIESNSISNNGKIFSNMFSDRFILVCCPLIYKFDFTDLIFQSPDYYFVDDFAEFEKSFSKSYLDFNSIKLRTASINESEIVLSDVFMMPNPLSLGNILCSIFSIIGLVILAILHLCFLIVYDFNKLPIFVKILLCILTCIWSFVPMIFGLVAMIKGMFLTRIVISLLIAFAAVSLATIVTKYSFFRSKEEKLEVEHDK